ncbi:fibronectin type III domain-containing protein [Virgibacillus salinus]|uniref:LPXTG-motif cell wall anchor domain-containing protein n=1 Tax=Virgibacillus salinus TaxID=553311 RepID=A0A1H1EU27_9BACI|nr:fibronectin type III domain-containing protein [Virgibacillus salinus]SDQ92253.1 LPXTG-motif cell wall anchor domain-containing protein [Virgibacillus salinus]
MKKLKFIIFAILVVFFIFPVNSLQAEELKTYDKLTLVDEDYQNDSLLRVYKDKDGNVVFHSIFIQSELSDTIKASEDQVLTAKKLLLAFYMKFDLTNKMNELLHKSFPKSNPRTDLEVKTIEISPDYLDRLEETESISLAYAKDQKAKFEQLSEAEQEAQKGYTFYYYDYGEEYLGTTEEYIKRLDVEIKESTDQSITISWTANNTNVPGGILYMYVSLDSKWSECFPVGAVSPCRIKVDGEQQFTLDNLEPSTTHKIRIGGGVFSEDSTASKSVEATTEPKSKNEKEKSKGDDVSLKNHITVDPNITKNTATLPMNVIDLLANEGLLTVNLEKMSNKENSTIQFSQEEMDELLQRKATIQLNHSEVELSVPSNVLQNSKVTKINLDKLEAVNGALSAVFDFSITQGNEVVSQFDQPITLRFPVDQELVKDTNNLAIYFLNEETNEWEKIGGTYKDGNVTATVNHFSTYTVFEESVEETTSNEGSTINDSGVTGKKLPNTASNAMNFLMLGLLFSLLAIALVVYQKKRGRA